MGNMTNLEKKSKRDGSPKNGFLSSVEHEVRYSENCLRGYIYLGVYVFEVLAD